MHTGCVCNRVAHKNCFFPRFALSISLSLTLTFASLAHTLQHTLHCASPLLILLLLLLLLLAFQFGCSLLVAAAMQLLVVCRAFFCCSSQFHIFACTYAIAIVLLLGAALSKAHCKRQRACNGKVKKKSEQKCCVHATLSNERDREKGKERERAND